MAKNYFAPDSSHSVTEILDADIRSATGCVPEAEDLNHVGRHSVYNPVSLKNDFAHLRESQFGNDTPALWEGRKGKTLLYQIHPEAFSHNWGTAGTPDIADNVFQVATRARA